MGKYILKRVLQFIPVFLGVTLILFALQNIVPGDPIKLIGGEKALTPEVELQLRVKYQFWTRTATPFPRRCGTATCSTWAACFRATLAARISASCR